MLGDIVPNNVNTVNGGSAVAAGPLPQPKPGSDGIASFDAPERGVPVTGHSLAVSNPVVIQASEPEATESEIRSVEPMKGRAPLILTVVGVLVFIGGVSGLFIYALSGS